MKILYWLEPHFELVQPGVMKTWLGWFERIAMELDRTESNFDHKIVSLEYDSLRSEFSDYLNERCIQLSQEELLVEWRITGNSFMELEHDRVPLDLCNHLLSRVRERLSGFEPDIVFLLNQQPWLRRGFPNALFVNVELSWTSRAPFPISWHLDVAGAGKGRILADHLVQVLDGLEHCETDIFLNNVKSLAHDHLMNVSAKEFVRDLRKKYKDVKLFPLGIFDNFDGQTLFFAVLDKFLGEQDGATALILTQHPSCQVLNANQLLYLSEKYPYVFASGELGTQYLLPCVDFVVGDFSTVATQALFFDTQVLSVRRELYNFPVDTPLRNPLVEILERADVERRSKILYWLLTHYSIPEHCLFDGAWLSRFLRRSIEAVRIGKPWAAYDVPCATDEDWAASKWRYVPTKRDSEARLYISEIVEGIHQDFSENRSNAKLYPVSGLRQNLELPMPPNLKPLVAIRLDPANRPVALRLHGLRLVNADGSDLWCWDGDQCVCQSLGGLSIRCGKDGLLLLCLNNDPHFDLAVSVEVLNSLKPNARLVVDFTPVPLQEVVYEVLIGDDQELSALRGKLKETSIETSSFLLSSSSLPVKLSNGIENLSQLFKESLARRDQKISEQANQMVAMRDDLLRAEAQLDLLKDLMLGGREEDRL